VVTRVETFEHQKYVYTCCNRPHPDYYDPEYHETTPVHEGCKVRDHQHSDSFLQTPALKYEADLALTTMPEDFPNRPGVFYDAANDQFITRRWPQGPSID
jgi:hypothetical protein